MYATLEEALKHIAIKQDDGEYVFLKLPVNGLTVAVGVLAEAGEPFGAVLIDAFEVSMMIDIEVYEEYQKRLQYAEVSDVRYRLITFDVALAPSVIGFMALVSRVLADAEISIMPFAAYSRDHILVPKDDYERAIGVLEDFIKAQS